jgi:branched-chain amino acid transport system permease protein
MAFQATTMPRVKRSARSQTRTWWQDAIRYGLVGGVAALQLSLVGIVTTFSNRYIVGDVLTLGQTMLFGVAAITGYAAARKAHAQRRQVVLAAGTLAGLVVGAMLGALVILGSLVNLRSVFINASPELYDLITFGLPTYAGALARTVVSALLGLLAAGTFLLPALPRRIVIQSAAAVVLVGLMADLLRVTIAQWGQISSAFQWLFSGRGLSIAGTIVVIAIVALGNVYRVRRPATRVVTLRTARQRQVQIAIITVLLLGLPLVMGSYLSEVADQIGLYVLMALGLNIVVGFAGLLDLGYVAFFAIGAYTMGILTSTELGFFNMSWWAAVPFAILAAVVAGVFLGVPVLRLRGDYLAIVTLGFGEIVRILVLSDWLKPVIGGSQGIQQIARPTIGFLGPNGLVFDDPQKLYYILLLGCVLAAFIAIRLRDSRAGRAWMAMREDEDVAQAMGIQLVATKLLAFATGAAFAGLSGAIFAAKLSAAYPNSFGFLVSINVLAVVIVGGMGSIPGVVLGALVMVGLPELLREFAEYRLMVYGAVLVVMMLFKPEGLLPAPIIKREMHATPAPSEIEAAQPTSAAAEAAK